LSYYNVSGAVAISTYVETIYAESYPMLDWKIVNDKYLELQERNALDETLPQLKEEKLIQLRKKWGEEYSDSEIEYMEDLFQGILQTQNVNGKLQTDDAVKLCKISLLLNQKFVTEKISIKSSNLTIHCAKAQTSHQRTSRTLATLIVLENYSCIVKEKDGRMHSMITLLEILLTW
jgi:hypothetical protein